MPLQKLPTLEDFKELTGRTGLLSKLKTKNDLDQIFNALRLAQNPSMESYRKVVQACIAWLNVNTEARKSYEKVKTLLALANDYYISTAELKYLNTQKESGNAVPIAPKPNLPFGRQLLEKKGGVARDVPRMGNQMSAGLGSEMQSRHWGPHVIQKIQPAYNRYKTQGGLLSIGAFADHIFLPNSEDDPNGKYLTGGRGTQNYGELKKEISEGVKYCTPEERKRYAVNVTNGALIGADNKPYDTQEKETHFSHKGWAIYVLGYDNNLYSNTHIVNIFHHSSFFGGGPVQCGGELCCYNGKLRYITNKTGHYRSSPKEFYRLLEFLKYHGVDLKTVLACNDVAIFDWYTAQSMFEAHGNTPQGKAPERQGAIRV